MPPIRSIALLTFPLLVAACPWYAERGFASASELLRPAAAPKLVAIDGWPGVGKTTLGRFLSWRFNVSLLETDLFLIPQQGTLVYLNSQIVRIIDARLRSGMPRPIIVEGTAVLRLLAQIRRTPDFVIHISNTLVTDRGSLAAEISEYESKFTPQDRADITIILDG